MWVLLSAIVPLAGIGAWIGYTVLEDSPFLQRLTDPKDLYARFEYWQIAFRIFAVHPLIGAGHMQFGQVYLNYVQALSGLASFDISTVSVADNIFITTLAEHGILGIVSLVVFLVFSGMLLSRFRKRMSLAGLTAQATFIRCSELALITYVVTGLFADVHLFTKATKFLFILIGLGLAEGVRHSGLAGSAEPARTVSDDQVQSAGVQK